MANDFKIYGDPVGIPNPKSDVYTKAETDKLLANKVNKEDVVSAYRFCGSVDTFDDLPKCYEFVPCGNPTVDGVEVGTFDAKNRTITLNEPMVLDDYVIRVPVDVTVAKGQYYVDGGDCPDLSALDTSGYLCYLGYPLEINTETKITEVYVGHPNTGSEFSGSYRLGGLYSYTVGEYGEGTFVYINNGDVYEVKKSGLNYGWTGSTWDALGTSHVDQEARDGIENLEIQMGDVEAALDEIVKIQNSLMGGEAE